MANCVGYTKDSQWEIERSLTVKLCQEIDSDRSRVVEKLVNAGDLTAYKDLPLLDPDEYQNHGDFAMDYLVSEILRKSPNWPVEVDTYAAARSAFYDAERQCKQTNDRLSPLSPGAQREYKLIEGHPWWESAFRSNLKSLLGPLRSKLDSFEDLVRNGPGAVIGVKGTGLTPADKYNVVPTCTKAVYQFADVIMGEAWTEYRSLQPGVKIVDYNRFFTVLKDATTDRGACTEASLTVRGQLALGGLIRMGLLSWGIDLRKQADVQRLLAKRAWEDGLATIDLKQASDTVALMLVWVYFPEDWAHILSLFRSPKTLVSSQKDGSGVSELVPLEKFSSMGNGFTFELETVIFTALIRTFVPKERWCDTGCFGDDIIVPSECVGPLLEALDFLGFSVNRRKSFLAGSFYESCGTDWWRGHNVRPFHLKGASDHTPYSLQIANKLRQWSSRINGNAYCDKRFKGIWMWLEQKVPYKYRECSVTPSLGDCGLIRSKEEALSRPSRTRYVSHPVKGKSKGSIIKSGTIETYVTAPTPRYKLWGTYPLVLSALDAGPDEGKIHLPVRRYGDKNVTTTRDMLVHDWRVGITYFGRDSIDSRGALPRRGLFGKVRQGWVELPAWPSGLEWLG